MRSVGWWMVWFVASCGFPRPAEVPATQIVLTSGDSQTGTAGSELAAPLVVTAEDAQGNPIAGVTVVFGVTDGGGSVSTDSVATDEQGQAQTTLTLGTTAGTNTVQASATDLTGSPISFTASGAAGPANHIVLTSGNNQSAVSGTTLGAPLVATVEDTNGNAVSGSTVTFVVNAGGGTVSAPIVTTDAQGHAQTMWTVGASGLNTVEARAMGLTNLPIVFVAGVAAGFAAKVDFTTGTQPSSIAIGDFNGDGKPDLAVANLSNTVSVLLNTTATGAMPSSFAAKVDFTTGSRADSVAIGDFNGDGKPDLAVAKSNASTVSVLLNTTATGATTPSFAAAVDFTTGSIPFFVAIGDVNGDGKPDLAVSNANSNTVSVLLNTTATGATTPSFASRVDFTTRVGPRSVAIRDVNGDTKPDLAVTNLSAPSGVSVLLNTTATGATTASFAARVDFTAGVAPYSVALGDVNGDGRPDLAVANQTSNTVSVLFNTTTTGATTPNFAAKVDFTTGSTPFSVAIGDVNGDGKPDLAVANTQSNTVSVLLNTTATGATTPSFAAKLDFTTGSGPISLAIGDVNTNGKPDLAVANYNASTVSVLLSQ